MRRRDRVSLLLCGLAVAAATLLIGGAPRWSQAIVAALAAGALATVLPSKRQFGRCPALLALLGVAIAWTALQIIPLPAALVAAVSPTLDGLRQEGAELAGTSPLTTLSVDPSATLRALTFLVTLTAIAVVALRQSVTERGRYVLCASIAVVAGVVAIVSEVHTLGGATTLYGLYQPGVRPPTLGPLLNPNHLGCLMAIGVTLSIGLVAHPKQRTLRRMAWTIIGGACLVVMLRTYSRGALVGLALGILVTLVTLVAQRIRVLEESASRRRREKFFATTLPIGVIALCSLVVAVYFGAGRMMNQLQSSSFDEIHAPRTKFAAWRSSMRLIEESPWVGVGRGGFESAFTRVHEASAYSTFSHAENEIVQAAVDWGIPAALALAVLVGWTGLVAVRRWRDGPLAAGALGAVMVVAFQSNFDFGIELLGIAVPMIVALATLTYVPLVEASATQRQIALRGAHIAAVAIGGLLLVTGVTRTIAADHDLLKNAPSKQTILESIETHPLDYLGYSALASELFKTDQQHAVRVLNFALRLHPTHAGLHRIAARLLVRANRLDQAEAEYSAAVKYTINPTPVIAEIVASLPPEHAARAIPLELRVDTTARTLPPTIAAKWLERVLIYNNDVRAAEMLLVLGKGTKDWSMAERGARHACRILPTTTCELELARILMIEGKPQDVILTLQEVADWHGMAEEQLSAWLLLCEAYEATQRHDEASACLRRLEISGLKTSPH